MEIHPYYKITRFDIALSQNYFTITEILTLYLIKKPTEMDRFNILL